MNAQYLIRFLIHTGVRGDLAYRAVMRIAVNSACRRGQSAAALTLLSLASGKNPSWPLDSEAKWSVAARKWVCRAAN